MAELRPGDEFAGCRIDAVAGRGGMGVVYRATQLALERPVALKLLAADRAEDRDFRERFQRESRMAAAIDHPNVIPVFAAGEEDGRLYLVMRYVGGTDLHGLLRARGALEPERAADIVAQVADALDAAHAAGLVHRDVKPANVLLEPGSADSRGASPPWPFARPERPQTRWTHHMEPRPIDSDSGVGGNIEASTMIGASRLSGDHAYLSDFGLTRLADAETGITQSGQWIGTVDYCSPEQLRGEGTDARADVYALGCVLYAALTGEPPFHRGTVPATMSAQLHDAPPRPSLRGAPAGFDRVVARALAKDPADRYPSAGDLGRAAQAAARGEAVTESERSVARGPAAPAPPTRNGHDDLPTAATAHATAATRLADGDGVADGADAAGEVPPGRVYRPVRLLRSGAMAVGVVAILAGIGLALAAVFGGGPSEPRSGPLSESEVRSAAVAFATAYEHEDTKALRRTLTPNVLRVLPGGVTRGRDGVVAQYSRQFDGKVRGYELSDLQVRGGTAGRASGSYRVDRAGGAPLLGTIAFGVVRDHGRPRIALIAATPAS